MSFSQFITGKKTNINTSGVPICDTDYTALNGILIYAEGPCIIGPSGVGYSTTNAGFPLASGDSLNLAFRHPEEVYVRAAVSGVTVYWVVI